jgi:hypothetical protein
VRPPEFGGDAREEIAFAADSVKHIRHPALGPIAFEYSAFAVDGRPDFSMVVYNPVTPADAEKVRSLTGSARALERT